MNPEGFQKELLELQMELLEKSGNTFLWESWKVFLQKSQKHFPKESRNPERSF